MRNKNREQLLVRVITLLDDARLGERQETVSHLLHSARRASRDGDDVTARQHSIEALSELRNARYTLRISGAAEQEIIPLEYAIAMLLPVEDEADAAPRAVFIARSIARRYLLLPAGLILAPATAFWLAGHLLRS